MAEKIKKYVKKELESGSSPEEVRETLVSAGWEEEEVKAALNMVLNGEKGEKEVVIEEDEDKIKEGGRGKERIRLFLFVLVVVMVVLLFAGMILAFTSIDPQIIFG